MRKSSQYRLNYRQARGFTLMEVLIAGFILFLVISTTTLIYRGALLSSHKAERSIYVNGLLPLIVDKVSSDIQANGQQDILSLNGKNDMGASTYSWSAEVIDYQAPPQRSVAETGISTPQNKRFKLWQVTINVEYNAYEREYKYVELSWNLNS